MQVCCRSWMPWEGCWKPMRSGSRMRPAYAPACWSSSGRWQTATRLRVTSGLPELCLLSRNALVPLHILNLLISRALQQRVAASEVSKPAP